MSEPPDTPATGASGAGLATLAPAAIRPPAAAGRASRDWTWLWWPTVLGSLASEVVAIVGSLPDSPFKLAAAGGWYFGESPASVSARSGDMIVASFIGFAGLIAMVRIWLYLVRALRQQPGAPLWRMALLLACWCAPLLVVAPLFSRDLYSYAAQGALVARHIDPYLHGPSVLGARYSGLVDGRWLRAPTPYGPLFVMLAGLMTRIAGPDLLTSLILLRLTAMAGVVLLAVSVPVIARRLGYDPALAFAVGVASPLVTFTLIAGGHNDALMAGLLAAGVACALAGRRLLAIAIIACAAAVKAPALLAIVPLAWTWRGPGTPARVRAAALAGGLALAGAILAALSLASGFGFGWVRNLSGNEQVSSWAAPATWLGAGLAHGGHWLGLPGGPAAWHAAARIACAVALVLIFGYLLWHSGRLGFACSLGLMLVALAVLSPVVQPWYLIWGLALLACVPAPPARRICVTLAAVAPFMGLPGGWLLLHAIRAADPLVLAGLAAALAVFAVVPFDAGATARLRSGSAAVLRFSSRALGR